MKPPHSRGPGNRSDGGGRHTTGGPRPSTPGGRRGNDAGAARQGKEGAAERPRHGGGDRPARTERPAAAENPPRRESRQPHSENRQPPAENRQPRSENREPRSENRLHLKAPPPPPHPDSNRRDEPRRPPQRDHQRVGPAPDRTRGPTPDMPRGTVWLYGVHAIVAALANPARRLRRLLLTDDAETALSARLPQPWPVQPERTERARLDQLLGRETVHQGAALLADLLTPPSLAQALERTGPVLILDQVTDPRNVGAILRTAAAFGVAAVIVQDRNAPEETGALAKAASGALEKVPLFRAVNIARTIIALKAANVWCVGLDASGAPLSAAAIGPRRVALVLGAEGEGMRRLTRETCDELAGLAMPKGHESEMESLNVSIATAIALYELCRPT